MRYSLQLQLLGPMLAVVVVASAATAVLAAWMGMRTARQGEEQRLAQLGATLADAGFPLTDAVLKRISGLSGAEFVTLDGGGHVQNSSRDWNEADRARLANVPTHAGIGRGTELPLTSGEFRAARVAVKTSESTRPLSLVILTSEERWDDLAWRAALPPLLAGLVAAGAAALFAVLLSQRFARRIGDLASRAAALAEGRFEPAPLPATDDELRDFAAALNATAAQLAQYEQQVRVGERLRTLGRLGAGMAHQLRNAITGARMALDLHAADLQAEIPRESLSVALRQLTLTESYLKRFLTLGRGETPPQTEVDLAALIADALELVAPICRHHAIAVDWRPPPRPMAITGDVEALRQMLLNLLINAIEAVQPLPHAERKVGLELATDDEAVSIRLWDHGPGPAADIAARLFERFVTNKSDGTGLGLAVAQEIAQEHDGVLAWRRDPPRTWFEVTFSVKPPTLSG
jgi:signal transduction histidine kinase